MKSCKFSAALRRAIACAAAVAALAATAVCSAPTNAIAQDSDSTVVARLEVVGSGDTVKSTTQISDFTQLDRQLASIASTGTGDELDQVYVDLYADWTPTSQILIDGVFSYTFYLHGHMINRNQTTVTSGTAQNNDSIFKVVNGKSLWVYGGTGDEAKTKHRGVRSSYVNGSGCVWNYDPSGDYTLKGGLICGNATSSKGGAFYIDFGSVYLYDTTVAGNYAEEGGGAYITDYLYSSISLENSRINLNYSKDNGGGIYVADGNYASTIKLESESEISTNYAKVDGGGIYYGAKGTVYTENIELKNKSHIDDNTCQTGSGGGIYYNGKNGGVRLENGSVIGGNWVHGSGGGIFLNNDGLYVSLMTNCYINENMAGRFGGGGSGGGIYVNGKTLIQLTDSCKIAKNSGSSSGGGVHIADECTMYLSYASEISNNSARNGGGIFNAHDDTQINLSKDSSISGNAADANGGGIDSDNDLVINGDGTDNITNNTAKDGNGGGMWYAEELRIKGIKLSGNSAALNGGGIYCDNTSFHAFALGGYMYIMDNTVNGSRNNLYLKSSQDMNGMDGDDALTADTRIGVTAADYNGSKRRKIAGNKAFLNNIGDLYQTCVTSDNPAYSVVRDDGLLYLDGTVSRYTVTFDTGIEDQEATTEERSANTAIGELPTPTRDHYTFAGWYVGDTEYTASTVLTGDVKLTAKWEPAHYKVTYVVAGENLGYESFSYGTKVPRPFDFSRDGYTFRGWYADEACTEAYDFDTPVSDDLTLYATWDVKQYTVAFETGEGSKVDSQTVDYGATVNKPAADPTREGYFFDGWYADEACSTEFDFTATVKGDVTVYAKWTRAVTLTFHAGEGTVDEASRVVRSGDAVGKLPTPVRDGYVFDGWYEDATRATAYSAFTENTMLEAHWRKAPAVVRLVTFYDGDEVLEVMSVKDGEKLDELAEPTKTGYAFTGYYANAGCTTAFDFDQAIDSDTDIYLGWKANEYTVSFDTGSEGSDVDSQTVAYGSSATKPEADPTREGCTFAGWYADKAHTVPFNFAQAVTDNVTVYAKWVVTVGFNAGDGVADVDKVTFEAGSKVGELPRAHREGYTFDGWYAGDAKVTEKTVFDKSATVVAKYTVTQRIVTFVDGSDALDVKSVDYGSTVAEPKEPTKDGYSFKGWYADEALTEEFDFASAITADTIVYAKWEKDAEPEPEPKKVTVTFDADGGACAEASREVEAGAAIGSLPVPTKEGLSFDGWYDGSTRATAYSAFSSDVTLTAKWRKAEETVERHLVTFADGDVTYDVSSVRDGEAVSRPADPEKDGYSFKGWYADEALTKEFDFSSEITADTTAYAKWEKDAEPEPEPEPEPDEPATPDAPSDGTTDGGVTETKTETVTETVTTAAQPAEAKKESAMPATGDNTACLVTALASAGAAVLAFAALMRNRSHA